jgi:hypothetical protein
MRLEGITQMTNTRRSGWSAEETRLLWETADEAQQQGLPLKSVFERIARTTGRRPNSIRNYYYAQVAKREGGAARTARFVPFTEEEVVELMEHVLRDRAQGRSVRSCLQRISNGDHSLMLRYQNKYRSVLKTRPELVTRIVEKLRAEGINAQKPEVNHRPRATLGDACRQLVEGAEKTGSPEVVRACETLARYLTTGEAGASRSGLSVRLDLYRMALDDKQRALTLICAAAEEIIGPIKEFLGQTDSVRRERLPDFCGELAATIGALEEQLALVSMAAG